MTNRFTILIIIRVMLLVGNVLLLAWIAGDVRLVFNQIILSLILIGQVVELIHFVNHTNRQIAKLFMAIRHSDFSITFKDASKGTSFKLMQDSFTEIIDAYKKVKIEKEIQYQFLQTLVKQIHVGIISLRDENIVLINVTAEKLLNIDGLRNWKLIQQLNPWIQKEIEAIGGHGRKLIEIKSQGEQRTLSIDISTLTILDKAHKLITIQDINSEIEQKEIEAWHKLIRILTHEIMNSLTPVSSLTETLQSMLTNKSGGQKSLYEITEKTVADIRFSLNTIHKRSEGLLSFVDSYRKLTKVPRPVIEHININMLFASIETLMKPQFVAQGIEWTVEAPPLLFIAVDPKLIEHVIINLVTNSLQAVSHSAQKKIQLLAYIKENRVVIEVRDTGIGIPQKELAEIFVPFFSTKKEGSGIGLSLSKQIMHLHGGRINAVSTPNIGTSFFLHFLIAT